MSEPARARPLLSNEDFALLRQAVVHYLKVVEEGPQSIKLAHLYHRLGSVSPK